MMPENRFEKTESRTIGCVLMASGKSLRYGTNKLLERLGGRELILHTAYHLREAGVFVSENREACLEIVAVTNDRCTQTHRNSTNHTTHKSTSPNSDFMLIITRKISAFNRIIRAIKLSFFYSAQFSDRYSGPF
jgi:hypothetical protein